MEIKVDKSIYQGGFSFLIVDGNKVGTNIILEECPKHTYVEPTFKLSNIEVQNLFDELYGLGLRPTKKQREAEDSLIIMQKHLNDMRKITSKFLKIDFE